MTRVPKRAATPQRATTAKAGTPRIFLATTGDADSIGALHVAAALARRDGAEVLAFGVSTPFPHNVSTMLSMKTPVSMDEENRRAVLETIRAHVGAVSDTEDWVKRAVVGVPSDEINRMAKRWNASLVVMGLGHHGRLDRLFGGETTVPVMRLARIPVLAVIPSARALPKRALAALDFTRASLSAARSAANLLADDGRLVLAHVCSFGNMKAHDGDLIDLYRAGAQAKLHDAAKRLRRQTHRDVETIMLEGDPSRALLAHAEQSQCDLIALGGHAAGLVDRILLGSVRTHVVRGAQCSVLIAPPDKES
jgi:nucleotide-binding universal stress UspA family protein